MIDAMLVEDLSAWRKQQHTARRVLARLVDEHGMTELMYSAVRDYVAKRRPQIQEAAGKRAQKAFVPQTHEPGAEAEVDFGDVWLHLDGELTKCALFTLRLSYSGKAIHRVYASQGQEAFIEGHLEAFRVLGGTPVVQIRYNNLRSAVTRVLFGRNRTESDRWVAFRSHYGFDTFYRLPGVEGTHEKGGVEGEVGRFRLNHLVPMPQVATLARLNARLEQIDAGEDPRRIDNRTLTIGHDFALEQTLLRPLPAEGIDPGLTLMPRAALGYARPSSSSTADEPDRSADGRRVTLHPKRGFTLSKGVSGRADESGLGGDLTAKVLTSAVLTTVLPDDDDGQEDHPWAWLASLGGKNGLTFTAAQLREVPYVVEFSLRVRLLART